MQANNTTTNNLFNQIASSITVQLDKKTSDEYCKKLFNTLIGDSFGFRNNKYTYAGSYDLSQWLVLSFDTMVKQDEKLFAEIVIPLIGYISIVDDACDEKITDMSIAEMETHCKIFKGESVQASNPAIKMGQFVYNLIREEKFDRIREKTLEFLVTGKKLIEKAKNGRENSGKISEETLTEFLEERRIDSMASLFFTINNYFRGISDDNEDCKQVKEYNYLACDIISLFNDVASIAKDAKKVVNNYIILNKGLNKGLNKDENENKEEKENLSFSELEQLPVEAFESSLHEVLELINEKLTLMETIKSSNPSYSKQFESIQEVMNGYCTWCKISKRFQRPNHLISEYHSKKSVFKSVLETILLPFLKPFEDNDMFTYLDDIENSMKQTSLSEIIESFVYSIGIEFCSLPISTNKF